MIVSTTTNKASYNIGEGVTPTITVRNTGTAAISVRINADIANPYGQNVKSGVFASSVALSPGQTRSSHFSTISLPDIFTNFSYQLSYRI